MRDFASRQDDGESMSVILEVRTPPLRVLRTTDVDGAATREGAAATDLTRRTDVATANLNGLRTRVDQLGLSVGATVLPGAHAVVVRVTSSQLRALMDAPEIAVIRPNRSLT